MSDRRQLPDERRGGPRRLEAHSEEEATFSDRMRTGVKVAAKRWWLVLICMAITVSLAYVFLSRQTPVYRATAKLVVGQRPPRVMTGIKEVAEMVDGMPFRFKEYMSTQLDIITSYEVARGVLDKEGLWADERLFGPATAKELELPAEELKLQRAAALARRIIARDVPDSMVVEVSFESSDPRLAAQIATATAEVYRDQNLELKKQIVGNAGDDLDRVIEGQSAEKVKLETALRNFEERQSVGTVRTRQRLVEAQLLNASAKLTEAQDARKKYEAELNVIRTIRKRGLLGVAAPQVLENPVITELKLRYIRQKTEVASLAETYGDKHPKIRAAKRQLYQLASSLKSEITAVLSSVEARLNKAVDLEGTYTRDLAEAQEAERQLADIAAAHDKLKKALTRKETMLDAVQKRKTETTLTRNLSSDTSNNIRLLNRALMPSTSIRPRRMLTLGASVFLGLLLGIGLSLLLETADTSIRSKAHAERVVGAPVIGLIPSIAVQGPISQPKHKRRRDLFVHYHPRSEVAEMGRALRTNLLFLSAERRLKTLAVTSPLPQEGKTTVAVQVSIALAAAGGRTVIIEADMRRPRLAETFAVGAKYGLSSYLTGQETNLDTVIQATEVPNLDTIVCGPIPSNPAELLNSGALDRLIAELGPRYDTLLFDTPPVNAVADALIMSGRMDGVLLVVKNEKTTTEALRHAYGSLESVNAPVLGLVLNDMDDANLGYYRGKYYRKGYYWKGPYASDEPEEDRPNLEVVKS